MAPPYTIGQLAAAAEAPPSTVRYYERRGLIVPERRSRSNYRLYDEQDLERLRFIKAAQAAGFTLSDIAALLEVRDGTRPPCEGVQGLIQRRLEEISRELERLAKARGELRGWLAACRAAAPEGRCRVVEGLAAREGRPAGAENEKRKNSAPSS